MNLTTAPDGTQSIIRALRVLKMFDDANPTWDLQDLTEASQLNKTTLFRILGALEHEGLLERTEDGSYQLGSETIALGGRAKRVNNLRAVSHPILKELTARTGESTTLEVLRETDGHWSMLVIDEVLGKHLIGIHQYIGSRLPVATTSTGKAVLAHLDDDYRQHISLALDEIATIQAQGYALAYGELEVGLVAIGAPIFGADKDVRAAISLTGTSMRIERDDVPELAALVCEHAQRISYQLGYRA